ncbi:MAG TPA: P22 phage major capsid protein family protein [Acidimicrobiales bacterium]|nr:P22 phage major capsid protein family protein [Acidimicrobiales bacterium]
MAIENFIPEIWASALLQAYHANAIVTPTVTGEYEGTAARGNTVHITTITTPTIHDYKAATRSLTPDALADTDTDLLIDQEKAFGFKVDDIDAIQAAGSFDSVTSDAGMALVEDAESYLLSQMLAHGTNTNVGTAAVTDFTKAYNALKSCRTALGKAKVPSMRRFAVVNPEFSDLLLDPAGNLAKANEAGTASNLQNGAITGRLLGFDAVLESPLLNSGTPTCIGYQMQGAAFVSQMDKVETLRSQDGFHDIVRGLHVYGVKVIRPTSVQVFASHT